MFISLFYICMFKTLKNKKKYNSKSNIIASYIYISIFGPIVFIYKYKKII